MKESATKLSSENFPSLNGTSTLFWLLKVCCWGRALTMTAKNRTTRIEWFCGLWYRELFLRGRLSRLIRIQVDSCNWTTTKSDVKLTILTALLILDTERTPNAKFYKSFVELDIYQRERESLHYTGRVADDKAEHHSKKLSTTWHSPDSHARDIINGHKHHSHVAATWNCFLGQCRASQNAMTGHVYHCWRRNRKAKILECAVLHVSITPLILADK